MTNSSEAPAATTPSAALMAVLRTECGHRSTKVHWTNYRCFDCAVASIDTALSEARLAERKRAAEMVRARVADLLALAGLYSSELTRLASFANIHGYEPDWPTVGLCTVLRAKLGTSREQLEAAGRALLDHTAAKGGE